jgi:hypothetical protein
LISLRAFDFAWREGREVAVEDREGLKGTETPLTVLKRENTLADGDGEDEEGDRGEGEMTRDIGGIFFEVREVEREGEDKDTLREDFLDR